MNTALRTLFDRPASKIFDEFFDWGFKDITKLNDFNNSWAANALRGFPHYNIKKETENNYTIEIALAGFSPENISVEVEDDVLTVSSRSEFDTSTYTYKGITTQAFTRSFTLHPESEVGEVRYENGILSIPIHTPEVEPPKKKTLEVKVVQPATKEKSS